MLAQYGSVENCEQGEYAHVEAFVSKKYNSTILLQHKPHNASTMCFSNFFNFFLYNLNHYIFFLD